MVVYVCDINCEASSSRFYSLKIQAPSIMVLVQCNKLVLHCIISVKKNQPVLLSFRSRGMYSVLTIPIVYPTHHSLQGIWQLFRQEWSPEFFTSSMLGRSLTWSDFWHVTRPVLRQKVDDTFNNGIFHLYDCVQAWLKEKSCIGICAGIVFIYCNYDITCTFLINILRVYLIVSKLKHIFRILQIYFTLIPSLALFGINIISIGQVPSHFSTTRIFIICICE